MKTRKHRCLHCVVFCVLSDRGPNPVLWATFSANKSNPHVCPAQTKVFSSLTRTDFSSFDPRIVTFAKSVGGAISHIRVHFSPKITLPSNSLTPKTGGTMKKTEIPPVQHPSFTCLSIVGSTPTSRAQPSRHSPHAAVI